MGTTATWALPYPEQSDPADVPVDMKELCDRLEAVLTQVKAGGAIPGEIRAWSGAVVPPLASYGHWVWADGAVYSATTYPQAAANIATQWKTHNGKADPGAGQFRVPDLRGCVLTGLDAMPGGARANRISRAAAATIAAVSGEEFHTLSVAEQAAHNHGVSDPGHAHSISDPGHGHNYGNLYNWGRYCGNSGTNGVPNYITGGNPGSDAGFDGQHGTIYGNTGVAGTGIGIYGAGTGISIGNSGGGGAHENLSPSTFVPYIVKLDD